MQSGLRPHEHRSARLVSHAFLRRRPVWVTLVLVVGLLFWHVWSVFAGSEKLASVPLANYDPERVHVVVTLGFAPEQFHMTALQKIGRILKVENDRVFLAGVSKEHLRGLAQEFWIKDIEPTDQ